MQENYTALHIAVESCKPAVVETLLGYGADVHVRGIINFFFYTLDIKHLPYNHFILRNSSRIFPLSLFLNAGSKLKETALHIAARVKDGEKCALMLLKSGAGPNLTTEEGQTPVHVAARYGNLQTLLLLLEYGGDPQFQNHVIFKKQIISSSLLFKLN